MKITLRGVCAALLCAVLAVLPCFVGAGASQFTAAAPAAVNSGVLGLDTDISNGCTGDYVVIYNPSVSASSALSTGDMSSLIQHDIDDTQTEAGESCGDNDIVTDVDASLLIQSKGKFSSSAVRTEYSVGDVHTFSLSYCNPLGTDTDIEFKVLAKGEYCYVWTPSGTDDVLHPLDGIDGTYAQTACDKFDASYPLLSQYFGAYTVSSGGDARINLMYYNIEDGWTEGGTYVLGFFSPQDCYDNRVAMLSLDTYPGVQYTNAAGEVVDRFERTWCTAVHEYQHLISFLTVGNMEVWLNECMSAAAEEICFPGSSIVRRIPGWVSTDIVGQQLENDPPCEYEYNPEYAVHNGASMYAWDDSGDNAIALYGQTSLFAQYLYSRFGNSVFKSIMNNYDTSGAATLSAVTGVSAAELVRCFRVALVANDRESYDSIYGFSMQQGYDASQYYNVENLYSWLSPVVFTGDSCTLGGGGAVAVKPVGGTYYPPENADSGLVYIGVKLNVGLMGDVDDDGDIDTSDALLALRYGIRLMELDDFAVIRGNVNAEGDLTSADALLILRFSLGLIAGF